MELWFVSRICGLVVQEMQELGDLPSASGSLERELCSCLKNVDEPSNLMIKKENGKIQQILNELPNTRKIRPPKLG